MASKVTFNFDNIQKKLSFYEQSQMKFAAQVSLTKFGKDLQKNIIPETYKSEFKNPVSFTLNSTFKKQSGLEMIVGVKDQSAMRKRGNPAANYLFPVIGRGSNLVYETLFSQHLKRAGYMNEGQYPYAVFDGLAAKFMKRKASNNRLTNTVYQNTLIGLGKTRDKTLKGKDRGNAKIQDARVIAFKEDKDIGKGKTYRAGIYRQITQGRGKKSKVFLAPLFMYRDLPTVPKRFFFDDLVIDSFRKTYPKIFQQELKRLTK